MVADWADEKAREWMAQRHYWGLRGLIDTAGIPASLAALLREVRHDPEAEVLHDGVMQGYCKRCTDHVLAEVRRVLEENAADLLDVALGYGPDEPGDPRRAYQREAAGARSAIACLENLK